MRTMLTYVALIVNVLFYGNQSNESSVNIIPPYKIYNQSDLDFIDAYKLKVDNSFLYGKCDEFIYSMGLPKQMIVGKRTFDIRSKADIEKVLSTAQKHEIVVIRYSGIDMWFVYDNEVIPSTIDFRKTNKRITYGTTIFDKTYTFTQFKKQFSKSASVNSKTGQSFFSMTTQEKGNNFEHYFLLRKSKDDSDMALMIELTFEQDNLIYMFFANF